MIYYVYLNFLIIEHLINSNSKDELGYAIYLLLVKNILFLIIQIVFKKNIIVYHWLHLIDYIVATLFLTEILDKFPHDKYSHLFDFSY